MFNSQEQPNELPNKLEIPGNQVKGKATKDRYKVAIVAPNCFYYQVDLFRQLANHPRIDLTVYFCSAEGLGSEDVAKMFGAKGGWGAGDELLDGYNFKFLRNYSPWPSYLNSLIGLMNWGIWREIKQTRPDGIVLMSWMNPTWWLAVLASLTINVPFLLMTDANVHTEKSMPMIKRWIRKMVLGKLLFHQCSGFLCAGARNKSLYELYGAPEEKLFPFAYSSGYLNLFETAKELRPQRNQLREEMGIPQDKFVILFCGRLSIEKNPFHLLNAYERLELPQKALIFVGNGNLKDDLSGHVAKHEIENVYFSGFQDRSGVAKFYAISDVMVLPSERETWGMVINEAMCFGLPVIASDAVGASEDMVLHGQNGFCYASGDDDALLQSIRRVAEMEEEQRLAMGNKSFQLIKDWSQRDLGLTMAQCLDHAYASKGG